MKDFFVGEHAKKPCESCHKIETAVFPAGRGRTIRYKGIGTSCTSCHADVHHGAMAPRTCDTCHTPKDWLTVSRAFHKDGIFPLEGRHLTVPCASCHLNNEMKGTPSTCESCHWERRHDDPYEARLGIQCGTCHRPTSWTAVNWDHAAMTGVALTPVHKALGCDGCHKQRVFTPNSVFCATCHQKDYNATTSPNHRAAGFPTTCETCHLTTQTSWTQANFNHSQFYQLVGVHATQPCAACHKNNTYQGTPTTCVGCHQTQYNQTKNPNHVAAGFPTTCETCHNATSPDWNTGSFNHNTFFPLVGVHATQPCASCHVNNVFKGTPTTCVGCHQAQFTQTKNPNHVAAGFPTTCDTCHNAAAADWGNSSFNHNAFYALVGTHAALPCAQCHVNSVYKGTPTTCVGCHQAQYNATNNPNHAAAGFPTTCEQCHNAASPDWNGAFNHASVFPLVGVHATLPCARCHVNNVFKGTPTTCYGCHQAQYAATTNPNHASAGFPTTCETCHNPAGADFSGATFNHASVFPLVGVHATLPCARCHVNSVYTNAPTTCYGCHQAQYNATTNPNHAAAGFPTTCEQCHNPAGADFSGATFNHNSFFALVGTHATLPCARCHVNGVYTNAPTTCYGCHAAQYNATTNPNHAAAGFPTTCETCHNPAGADFSGATFNHNTFFVLVGRHLTAQCSQCHVNSVYTNAPTTCYGCHAAQYNATTNPNHAAAGFPTTCEQCHNPAGADFSGATFNHTFFPITSGRHAGIACNICHTTPTNYAVFTCMNGCHAQATTASNHRGVNGYQYVATACYACHPRGSGG